MVLGSDGLNGLNDLNGLNHPFLDADSLTQIPGVPERIPTRLRPDGQAVRFGFYRNAFHIAIGSVDDVDRIVVAAGQPELLAIDGDIAHVGAAAARDRPGRFDFTRRKVNDADTAFAFGRAVDAGDATIGNI